MTLVSKRVEFDAGHRVARHESKCQHPHGHRYAVTLTVAGKVRHDDTAQHGMVVDFGKLAAFLATVHEMFDHCFIVDENDHDLCKAFSFIDDSHVRYVAETPTAEHLAEWIGLDAIAYFADEPFDVHSVQVNETPTSTAIWQP